MATNQDKIATIGDIKTLLATAKEKGVTIKKSDGTEWTVPSSFTDDSLCPTFNQINGTVLPSYADNASDKLSSTDGVVIGNFKGSATAYTDTQLVRLGDITLKATTLDSSSFSLAATSKVETSCALSATCEYSYDVNVSSYSYEDTTASTSTSTVTGTSGTWSGTDSSTSNILSNQGQNMSFTNTMEYTISCSVTLKGETLSDSLTLTQPKREQGKFISSSSTEDSHALEAEVDKTSFDCDGGTANVTWYHVYGSATSKTYEDTCGVQYTETNGEGRPRVEIGTEAYPISSITCDPMTDSTTISHTLTSSYTYTDSEGNSQTVDGSVDVSQKCDCSCTSCFKVNTNNLPSTGHTSGFTCATVTVTGTNSICSVYTGPTVMPSTIYVADEYSSWITSAWTSIINKGVAVQIHCTQNDTSETRYATLILSGDTCAEGIEIHLTQEAAVTEHCSIVGGYHHTCSTLPSGTLLSYRSITSDTESCSSIRFESTDFEMKYESPYINVEYLQIADNGKTIQVYGSMDSNLSEHEVGAVLSVTATTSNGIKKYDIPIEQEACSECWDCFQLNTGSSYTYIGDDGKTIYANASGSTSQSDTLINFNKKSGGICSDYAMYTNLELVDNGYGTDWINILHFNEAGGNYIVTSGGMSPNNTNNLRTCTFRYTASAGTSCPIDILVIQPSSPNSCYNLHSSDIPYSASTNAIVADIVKTGTTSVCDTMPSFFDQATVIKGSYWITRATTQDKGNNDTGLYLSYTENTTQSRRYGVVRLSSSTNPQAFFDCELYQRAAPIEEFQITGVTLQHVCKEERKAYYTIDYQGTAPSTATCTVQTVQYGGEQYGVGDTAVTVNHEVQSIAIHPQVSSASTISLTVIPNSGVNTSSPSFRTTIESNNWIECSGTISLQIATVAPPITSGSTTEAMLTLNLEYSGPKDIDTNGLTISFNYYLNITVAHSDGSRACPTCSASYLDKPLCNFIMTLKGLQLKSLINNGRLSYSELMTVANVSPSICSYSFGTQYYVSASSSDTTKIKIGNGFSAPPLG